MSGERPGVFGRPRSTPGLTQVAFPTQDLADVDYTEDVAYNTAGFQFKAFLTPHPRSPLHKLVAMTPYVGTDNLIWIRETYSKLPGRALVGQQLTASGQVGTLTVQTVAYGTEADSGPLIESSSVQPRNAQQATKTTLSVPEVFDGNTITTQQAFELPERFLPAGSYKETRAYTAAGTAAVPDALGDDGTGIVSASATRVTAVHVRKENKFIQGPVNSTLTTFKKAPDGQTITVTETLSEDGSAPSIDARTLIAETEAVGGGSYIQTVGTVPAVLALPTTTIRQTVEPPRKFLTITSETTTETHVEDGAVTPDMLGADGLGVVEATAEQTTLYTGVKRATVREGSLGSVTEHRRSADGQLMTVVSSYGTSNTITLTATTEFAQTEALGNGNYVVTVGTVPVVLALPSVSKRQAVEIPMKFFSGVTETTTESTVEGSSPVADDLGSGGTGVLASSARQLDAFRYRKTTTTRTASAEPAVEYRRSPQGQIITITSSAGADGSIPDSLSATTVVSESSALGNGQFIRTSGVVDEVFSEHSYTIVGANLVPFKFRRLIGEQEESFVTEGTAAAPSLDTGDLSASETQLTVQTKRVVKRKLGSGTSISLTSKRFVPELNTTATMTETYSTGAGGGPSTGMNVLSSDVQAIGNGGSFKTDLVADSVPSLHSGATDPFLGVVKLQTHTRVDPATLLNNAPAGLSYHLEPRGNYSILTKTQTPIPQSYSFKRVVAIALPRVLIGMIRYLPKNSDNFQNYGQYRHGGVAHVTARVDVTFTTSPSNSKPVIQTSFQEAAWDFPGFSGSGLTNGDSVLCVAPTAGGQFQSTGDVKGQPLGGGFQANLPLSTPTAREWLALLGKELLVDYRCEPWEAQIFREEWTYATLPA